MSYSMVGDIWQEEYVKNTKRTEDFDLFYTWRICVGNYSKGVDYIRNIKT